MAGFDNTNKGVLFKNDKKGVDSRPDYKGSVNVEGTEYWFSGWIKTAGPNSKNPGSKFLSVAVEVKDNGFDKPSPPPGPQPKPMFDDMEGDIPF